MKKFNPLSPVTYNPQEDEFYDRIDPPQARRMTNSDIKELLQEVEEFHSIHGPVGRHKTYALAVMEAIRVLDELEQNKQERKVMPVMRAKLEVNDVQPWVGGVDA